jgi:hypothetical protein
MKTEEIKSEIHNIVDKLPDHVLDDVLYYLKKISDINSGASRDTRLLLPFNLKRDRLFDDHLIEYIFKEETSCHIFFHYTQEKSIAEKILSEGFKYTNSFDKTATFVRNNWVELNYKHYLRKPFGPFIVIICISDKLYEYFVPEIKKIKDKDVVVENFLSETEPELNDEKNLVYLLYPSFIKGYINYETGELVENPKFNPDYNSPAFKDNADKYEKN